MIRTLVLMRKIPLLKRNKRIVHFFAFDTETYRTTKAIKYLENEKKVLDDSYIHKMRILSYVHIFIEGSNYKVVNERVTSNTEDFVNEILNVFNLRNSPSTIYIFSFNLRFDLLASRVLEILSKKGFYVSPGGFYFENAQSFVTMERYNIHRGKKQKITFIDLRNYFRVGNLNSIAKEIIGKEKDEIDIMKYVNKENLTKEELETLSKYCLKDSQLVAEIVIFLNENLFKKYAFGLTISSVAFDTYRKYFLKDIYIHKFEKVKEIERQSYYGGRTECFKIGNFNEKVYIYDINSLYPSQYSNLLPSQFVGMFKNISVNELFKLVNEYLVIAKVKVNITENKIPYRMNNKLIFPVGKFTTYLCQPELELLNKDEILNVDIALIYKSDYLFKDFAEYFYTQRLKHKKEGKNNLAMLDKYLLNSLYGKFAQTNVVYKLSQENPLLAYGVLKIQDLDGKVKKAKVIMNKMYEEVKKKDFRYNFVAISSFISSYGRRKLWEYIKLAGQENVYYVDTDSLFVNKLGSERLRGYINDKLGYLKLEEESSFLNVYGLKDYETEKRKKLKGIPKSAILENGTYVYRNFVGFNESIHYYNAELVEYQVRKKIKRIYDKGIVKDNIVYPFMLNQA